MSFLHRDYRPERIKLRETENPRTIEFAVRVFGLSIPVAAGYLLGDMPILLPWYVCILSTVAFGQVLNMLLYNNDRFWGLCVSIAAITMQAAVAAYLPYWLWQTGEPVYQFLGTLVIVAGVLHIVIQRELGFVLLVALALPFFIVCAVIGVQLTAGAPGLRVTVLLSVFLLSAYSFIAIRRREQQQRSLDATLDALAQSQKLSAIARVMAGIAHDFNNVLTVILGSLDLLRQTKDAKEARVCLADAEMAARRGAELVADLLKYARSTPARSEPCDVVQTCTAICA